MCLWAGSNTSPFFRMWASGYKKAKSIVCLAKLALANRHFCSFYSNKHSGIEAMQKLLKVSPVQNNLHSFLVEPSRTTSSSAGNTTNSDTNKPFIRPVWIKTSFCLINLMRQRFRKVAKTLVEGRNLGSTSLVAFTKTAVCTFWMIPLQPVTKRCLGQSWIECLAECFATKQS